MILTTSKPFFLCCLAVILLSVGCDREDEAIPTYIEIQPFELSTNYINEGSNSHKITDAWLYVGGDFLGIYELPASVPVLTTGSAEIIVYPGIKLNGLQRQPEINYFYKEYRDTLDFQPNGSVSIQPTTTYKDNVAFPFIESFDGAHLLDEEEDSNPNTTIAVGVDGAFENASGFVYLDTANIELEAATSVRFANLPTNNSTVYLELDYKTEIPFALGLIGHAANGTEAKQYIIVLNEKEDWNKIYIDLTGELAASGLDEYQIVINAILQFDSETGGFIQDEAYLYLDNIKLVHFQ